MRSIPTILILFLITNILYAQNITSHNANYSESNTLALVDSNKILKLIDSTTNQAIEQKHFDSGQIKSENYFISSSNKKFHGKQTYWFENGVISSEINYKNGKKDGSAIYYWKNGQMKRDDIYEDGKLNDGLCWNINGEKIKYSKFKIQPEFPGGTEGLANYLSKNLKYPRNSRTSSIRGKVIVCFKIEKDGKPSDVKILKGVNSVLNNEAKRAVENMPEWKPALLDGKPVSEELTIPIVFFRN